MNNEIEQILSQVNSNDLEQYEAPNLKLSSDLKHTPLFPESVFARLPNPLKTACYQFDDARERDVFFFACLISLSSVFSENTYTMFNRQRIYTNLYGFITAKSGSGKGTMSFAKDLIKETNKRFLNEWRSLMDEYENTPEKDIKLDFPAGKPRFMSKVIPSNITTPRFIEMLEDMQHSGVLMFETECDAILKKMKSEHGEYTDIFRKAFTHESIQKLIKQEDSFNNVELPKLSVLVSGTPNQPKRFFGHGGNAENGTLQRFMFYVFDKASIFLSKWGCNGENEGDLPQHMAKLSAEVEQIAKRPLMELEITEQQGKKFEEFWQSIERKYMKIYGDDVISVTRRLSMSFTRIAMILQRMVSHTELLPQNADAKIHEHIGDKVTLSDDYFILTCDIMNVIINHTFTVWEFVTGKKPNEEDNKGSANTQKSKFLYSIEEAINNKIETGFEFTIKTAEIKEIASDLDIKWRTAQRYIKEFISNGLIEKSGHGEYELKNKDDD